MDKSKKYISQMVGCKTEETAVEILVGIVDDLGLSQNEGHLLYLKNTLEDYQKRFRTISDGYRTIAVPTFNQIQNTRIECNFLMRDCIDQLSMSISTAKMLWGEDRKTVVRAESMLDVAEDEELNKTLKTKSSSGARNMMGASKRYTTFVTLQALSYGLWGSFNKTIDSFKLFTDSLAAASRNESTISVKDVK